MRARDHSCLSSLQITAMNFERCFFFSCSRFGSTRFGFLHSHYSFHCRYPHIPASSQPRMQLSKAPPIAGTSYIQRDLHAAFLLHLFAYHGRAVHSFSIFSRFAIRPCFRFFGVCACALRCDRFCDLTRFIAALDGVCTRQTPNAQCMPDFMCGTEGWATHVYGGAALLEINTFELNVV